MRGFKNNGALLVLLWVLLPFTVFNFSYTVIQTFVISLIVISAVSFPIVGILSDIYLGRYKTIRYSLWVLWLSLIAFNVFLIVKQYAAVEDETTQLVVGCLIGGCIAVSMSGVIVNTMQFGIDQLTDASSSNICSYISWYVWIIALASNLAAISQNCSPYNQVIGFFILPFLCTAVIVSDMCFNKWLVKEPASRNPFKIIFQVLRYATKNKYPRLRSAFTYWEDRPYSRIDLGKAKYGGPFTTEQVEDVKTFFRILGITVVYSPLSGLAFFVYSPYSQIKIINLYNNRDSTLGKCDDATGGHYISQCYKAVILQQLPIITMTVFVPVLEFILYPVFVRCRYFNNLKILKKLLLGILMLLLYELSYVVEKVAIAFTSNEGNSTCLIYDKSNGIDNGQIWSNYTKFMYQQPLLGIAIYVLFTSAVEFVCAQSPYSMKGVLVGIFFVVQAFSWGVSTGLLDIIQRYVKPDVQCGVWLHIAITGALIVGVIIHVITSKCYKFQKRDDILSNEQMFAENYFDKYLMPRSNFQ